MRIVRNQENLNDNVRLNKRDLQVLMLFLF